MAAIYCCFYSSFYLAAAILSSIVFGTSTFISISSLGLITFSETISNLDLALISLFFTYKVTKPVSLTVAFAGLDFF